MAELSEAQKDFVVRALAQFTPVADIVKALGEEGVIADRRQIAGYDASKTYYEAGEKWRVIFQSARDAYLTEVVTVPIANQGYRVQMLQKILDLQMKRGNMKGAQDALLQAAEEIGGALTNERVNINKPAVDDMSPEERRLALASLIEQALALPDPAATAPSSSTPQ